MTSSVFCSSESPKVLRLSASSLDATSGGVSVAVEVGVPMGVAYENAAAKVRDSSGRAASVAAKHPMSQAVMPASSGFASFRAVKMLFLMSGRAKLSNFRHSTVWFFRAARLGMSPMSFAVSSDSGSIGCQLLLVRVSTSFTGRICASPPLISIASSLIESPG